MSINIHEQMRPQTWDEVYGNAQAISEFRELVEEEMVHVFLIQGDSGIGKTTIARIAARALEAEVIEMNAADQRGVEDWRAITAQFPLMPLHGRRKAYIIDECQQILAGAWELLLKPMESAPKHLYLFFCTTKPGAEFPRTAVDRMRPILLKAPNLQELGKFAQDKAAKMNFKLTKDVKAELVRSAAGSFRRCLSRLDSIKRMDTDEERLEYLSSMDSSTDEAPPEVLALFKVLLNTEKLADISEKACPILAGLRQNKITPLAIRMPALQYFSTVYLTARSEQTKERALRVLYEFGSVVWPETTTYASVILAVHRVSCG